jgi:galacturan 1,4-alpha-galacturonidase
MFWKWGGKNIKLYGKGVLNGNGQRWWNGMTPLNVFQIVY